MQSEGDGDVDVMKRDADFEGYLAAAKFLTLFIPGMGQLAFLHWSFAFWFLGAVAAWKFAGVSGGIFVHLLCFHHASGLYTNIMTTIRRHSTG